MDVLAVGEGLAQLRDVGGVGEQAELDLAVVGRDQLHALLGDEGGADAAAFLGADRDVLQVRVGGREPAGGGRAERIGGVHPAGLRMDELRQEIGVGRFQLRQLAPVEDAGAELVAFGGEVLEHARAGRPGAGARLGAAGEAELAEQDVAELLGRADVELFAGMLVDLRLVPGELLGELARHARQDLPVDLDAARFHARQHRHQRPLERLVDVGHVLGDEPRLQHQPQPQRHVGVLGRVFRRLVERHLGDGDRASARCRRRP